MSWICGFFSKTLKNFIFKYFFTQFFFSVTENPDVCIWVSLITVTGFECSVVFSPHSFCSLCFTYIISLDVILSVSHLLRSPCILFLFNIVIFKKMFLSFSLDSFIVLSMWQVLNLFMNFLLLYTSSFNIVIIFVLKSLS